MIIGPTLTIVIFCILLVSSLITSVASNITKFNHQDYKAYDYAVASSSIGFGSIGVLIGFLLIHKLYYSIEKIYLYSLLWLWVILISLTVLTYLSYDQLTNSYHAPIGAKYVGNETEKHLAFAAFCISIVGLSVGITYVITTGIHEGYFDSLSGNAFGIKSMFESLFGESSKTKKEKVGEQIEMDNLISDLTETSF